MLRQAMQGGWVGPSSRADRQSRISKKSRSRLRILYPSRWVANVWREIVAVEDVTTTV